MSRATLPVVPRCRLLVALFCLVGMAAGATFSAWADEGSDFQVNTSIAGDQQVPVTAMAPDGRFAVVWQSQSSPGDDSDGSSIVARLYNADGEPSTGELQINGLVTGDQAYPSVAMAEDGTFVVAWESASSVGDDDSGTSIQARRFGASGAALAAQFQVNALIDGMQGRPRIALAADKRFVVVWEGQTLADPSGSIQGRVFTSDGAPLTDELTLNTITETLQFDPDVAMAPSGDWLTVWTTYEQNAQMANIGARLVDRLGSPDPFEFQVNTQTLYLQSLPAVDAGPSGEYVVVWQTDLAPEDPSLGAVRGQRLSATASAQGGEFAVNTTTLNYQTYPDVAFNDSDEFLVVWTSGHIADAPIMAQRYQADGERDGGEFQVSQLPTSYEAASVGAGSGDTFVVTWHSTASFGNDQTGKSVQAQWRRTVLLRATFETGDVRVWD